VKAEQYCSKELFEDINIKNTNIMY